MFRTGSFILRLLLALVLLAGVAGVTAMAFRAGYSQGYILGAAAEGDAPQANAGHWMVPGMVAYAHPHFFPPFGLFFCAGFLALIFLAAIFRPRHWHHHTAWAAYGHPGHGPWGHSHGVCDHPHGPEHAAQDPGHAHHPRHTEQPSESKPDDRPSDQSA